MHDDNCQLCGTQRVADWGKVGRSVDMLTNIRRDGYHRIGVPSGETEQPDFVYTVGMFHMHGHPEVVVFGLDVDTGFSILAVVHEHIAQGAVFSHGDESREILDGFPVVFLKFSGEHYGEYVGQANNFYMSSDFPVLMLTWPSRDGSFPWSDDPPAWLRLRQPALWTSAPG